MSTWTAYPILKVKVLIYLHIDGDYYYFFLNSLIIYKPYCSYGAIIFFYLFLI